MAALLRASRVLPALARARPAAAVYARGFAAYPSDRKYKASHEWAKVDGEIATIGITDHAQAALGEIVFAELPELGTETTAGDRAATVESVKAAADIYAPIGGEVVDVNNKLEETPGLINEEPHDEGWIFRVKVSDPGQLDELMDSNTYEKTIVEEEA